MAHCDPRYYQNHRISKGRAQSSARGHTCITRCPVWTRPTCFFFFVEICFCTIYNFNKCYFFTMPLNTQVRDCLSLPTLMSLHTLSSLSPSCGNFANPLSCGFCYLCQIISAQSETRIEDSSLKQVDLQSFWVTCPKFRFGQFSRLDFL